MRIRLAAVLVVILAGSAYAQEPQSQQQKVRPGLNLPVGGDKPAAEVDPARESEYKSAIEKIPNKKLDDPWSGVRSDATPASPKTTKTRKTDR